jgi:hypothetical protein
MFSKPIVYRVDDATPEPHYLLSPNLVSTRVYLVPCLSREHPRPPHTVRRTMGSHINQIISIKFRTNARHNYNNTIENRYVGSTVTRLGVER